MENVLELTDIFIKKNGSVQNSGYILLWCIISDYRTDASKQLLRLYNYY